MNICGKALPPKAAMLLSTNTLLLVLCMPLVLATHSAGVASSDEAAQQFVETLVRMAAIGLFCQIVFYYSELYNLQIARNLREQVWRVFGATGIVLLALAAIFSIFPALSPGRDALLGLPLFAIAVVLLTRRIALVNRHTKVALIGGNESCSSLQESIQNYPEWNMEVKATYSPNDAATISPTEGIDRIIVSADAKLKNDALEYLMQLKFKGVRIESAARFYERATGRVQLNQIDQTWFVFSNGFEHSRRRLFCKRLIDILAAGALLVFTAPLMAAAIIAILLEGKGPLFYRQDRVGYYGRVFRILKFRTMVPAPPGATPQWTANQDRRITPLGRFMRTFRVDELPQLLNVLLGDMSLVGPRPEQPYFVDLLSREIPFYHQRHTVPPGLTGWAQVRFRYGASIEESRRKLEFDLFYVKNFSILLDLAIAFETLKVVVMGQGAK